MTHSPAWLYPLAAPLSAMYGAAINLRNLAYKDEVLKHYKAGIPVVSIGGITAGGAGKTPLAIWTLSELLKMGVKVGLLSRGYGRNSKSPVWVSRGDGSITPVESSGDEPRMIAERLPKVFIHCDSDRVRGASSLKNIGCEIIVLDDGFQHRRLHRDLDWVSLDTTLPPQAYRMLPLGYLREGFNSITERASGIWLRLDESKLADKWHKAIEELGVSIPIVSFRLECETVRFNGNDLPSRWLSGKKVFSFAGIAHPKRFLNTLSKLGAKITGYRELKDHQEFTPKLIDSLCREYVQCGAELIAVTEKDWVKLPEAVRALPIAVIKVDVVPIDTTDPMLMQLKSIIHTY